MVELTREASRIGKSLMSEAQFLWSRYFNFYLLICLAVWSLSCSPQELGCLIRDLSFGAGTFHWGRRPLWWVNSGFEAFRPSFSLACGILVSRPDIEPVSPALQGGFLTTGSAGKSPDLDFNPIFYCVHLRILGFYLNLNFQNYWHKIIHMDILRPFQRLCSSLALFTHFLHLFSWSDWPSEVKVTRRVQFFLIPWTIQSTEFSRPEYWNG